MPGFRLGFGLPWRGPSTPAVAPANTALPVITQTGSVLSVTTGTWTGTAATYSYQWSRNGTSISGATSATYSIPAENLNALFGCIVTATNAAGNASAAAALLYVGVLDVLSVQPALDLTLRRQSRNHTGDFIRVRRSTDQAETNIGFATAIQTRTNLDPVPAADGDSRTSAGITRTVVGTGTEFGQSYVDIRWQGTATAAVNLRYCSTILTASPNATTNALVTPGQTYTSSMGYRLVAGTWPAVTARMTQFYRNGTTLVGEANNSLPTAPTTALQRCAVIGVAPATANYVQNIMQMDGANGIVVDFTMRFYAPNTELGTGNARPLLQRYVAEPVADVGDIDATTLLNFVGSGSAFIQTWFDKSGNSRNAIRTTTTQQPRIVDAGALETENGKPTVRVMGGQFMTSPLTTAQAFAPGMKMWISSVFRADTNTQQSLVSSASGNSLNIHAPWQDGNTYFDVPGTNPRTFGPLLWTNLSVGSFISNGITQQVWKNGVLSISSVSAPFADTRNSDTSVLFAYGMSPTLYIMKGCASNMMIFPTAPPAAERQIVERNQGAHFGFSVA